MLPQQIYICNLIKHVCYPDVICHFTEQSAQFSFSQLISTFKSIIFLSKTMHKRQTCVKKVELIRLFTRKLIRLFTKHSPLSQTSRVPESEAADWLKGCYIEESDWLRRGQTEVGGRATPLIGQRCGVMIVRLRVPKQTANHSPE